MLQCHPMPGLLAKGFGHLIGVVGAGWRPRITLVAARSRGCPDVVAGLTELSSRCSVVTSLVRSSAAGRGCSWSGWASSWTAFSASYPASCVCWMARARAGQSGCAVSLGSIRSTTSFQRLAWSAASIRRRTSPEDARVLAAAAPGFWFQVRTWRASASRTVSWGMFRVFCDVLAVCVPFGWGPGGDDLGGLVDGLPAGQIGDAFANHGVRHGLGGVEVLR